MKFIRRPRNGSYKRNPWIRQTMILYCRRPQITAAESYSPVHPTDNDNFAAARFAASIFWRNADMETQKRVLYTTN